MRHQSEEEAQLCHQGVTIEVMSSEELHLDEDRFADIVGVVVAWPATTKSCHAIVAVRQEFDQARWPDFAHYVRQRLDRFIEHGPGPDGWEPRNDGGYQLWPRPISLPPLD